MTKRVRYCTHLVTRRSRKLDRCFTTDAAAVRFCRSSANRGRCCEVYHRKAKRS
jgi:hypothetical protein